jgi:DNA invertase Pin-like site-specific DNA recombinase
VRISDDTTGEGLGVARQELDCRQLCDRRGWQVVGLYSDNDRSAFSGKRRDEYERLCDDVKAGALDVIVAWHADRLHRSPKELESFIDLLELTGVTVATVTGGDRDFTTSDGRFMARMEGVVARRESEHKSERIVRKHRELIERGAWVSGGRRPFGYDKVSRDRSRTGRVALKVNQVEARLIRQAAKRVLAGESLYSIVTDWNARAIPTVTGTAWEAKVLRQILTSGRVAGWRDHHGEPVTRSDEWKAILDEQTWRAVRAILLDPARRRTVAPRSYLLAPSLLRCGGCGGPLVASPQRNSAGDLVPAYGCRKIRGGCGSVHVRGVPVEEMVVAWTLGALADESELRRLTTIVDDSDGRAEVAGLEADLERLSTDHYVDKLIGRAEFLAARTGLVARLDDAKTRLASVVRRQPSAVLADLHHLDRQWPGLGLDRQRALIDLVLARVTVMPITGRRNVFDPARVIPEFR